MSEFNNELEQEELKKLITLKFERVKDETDQKDKENNKDKFYDLKEWYVSKEIKDGLTYIFLKLGKELNLNYFGIVVKTMTDGDPFDDNDNNKIPLANMNLGSFKKIMDITEILKDIPFSYDNNVRFKINKPLMHENFYDNISMEESTEIDISTIKNNLETYIENLNNKDLSELANVTNYLDLSDILELICARIAFNIREMDEEQISNEFGEN